MSVLALAPRFSEARAVELAFELYGLNAEAFLLASERDQNFKLVTKGATFVLKIANASEELALLEAQNAALEHVGGQLELCPKLVLTKEGLAISVVESAGDVQHFVRLLSYLPGKPLAKQGYQSEALLLDLGQKLGQLDKALAGFDHSALHRDFYWDLAKAPNAIEAYKDLIQDDNVKACVEYLYMQFKRVAQPYLGDLRQSIIHNDANDYNVLVGGGSDLYSQNQSVTGLIDYGDMVYSHTLNDLAIAIAYTVLGKAYPLDAALPIIKGYHAEYPLTELELKLLFPLVTLRLCASACIAAHQQSLRPNDAYLGVSQEPIRKIMPLLKTIHPRFAEAKFREVCGFEPSEKAARVQNYLKSCTVTPLLKSTLEPETTTLIDLSVTSLELPYDTRIDKDSLEPDWVFSFMRFEGATVGVGRYDEPRLIYSAPEFATGESITSERRTVHLGLDLFVEAGEPIFAPLAGWVHAVAHNPLHLDYGHVLILRHETPNGDDFYTMYGHLKADVLLTAKFGQAVAAGDEIARVGDWRENGGWAPHLHVQIITDLLDLDCNFPAVFRASEREVWKAFCLNPNLLVGLPEKLATFKEIPKTQTLAERQKRIGRSLSIGYNKPLKMLRGRAQYLFDETGRQYLDAYNNVPHVGHAHPKVVAAGQKQMALLNTNTRYLSDGINAYAEQLAATLPEPLNVCFFVSSGSEANELALRLARAYTGQKDLVVLEGAYHGHTTSLIDISPYKHAGPGGAGAPDWVHTVPVADTYRGLFKADKSDTGKKYATFVKAKLAELGTAASFIAESCPSVGGQIFFPEHYLAETYQHIRAAGGLCIADEVQTAYGRTGSHFYAFEEQGVMPDMVVLGKPIGNGHPLAAVITTQEIADAFHNGMEFFATFGGNNVSCAIGKTVLDVVQEENLQQHAQNVGQYLLERLKPLKDSYELIGDIRGRGLFLGLELVKDRATLEPAALEASFIVNQMREAGILLGTDGPLHNVIKIRPPMPFTQANADLLVETFETVLKASF